MPVNDDISIEFIENMINETLLIMNRENSILFQNQLSEPCINHRYAICLENYLRNNLSDNNISVDCEYNKT